MAAAPVEAPVVNPAKVDAPCVKPVSSSTCPCASRCASLCVSPFQQVVNDFSPECPDFSAFLSDGYVSPFSQYSDTGDRILGMVVWD